MENMTYWSGPNFVDVHNRYTLQEAMKRLNAYEASGFTPERVQDLAKAERDDRLAILPFSSFGLIAVSGGYTTIQGKSSDGRNVQVSGKVCIFECSKEESSQYDLRAEDAFAKGGKSREQNEN